MEKLKTFDEATAEAKQEWTNTLYQVATMKAHFELLKQAIMSKLELDYYGKDLRLGDSTLLVEVLWLIAPDDMSRILDAEQIKSETKAQEKKAQEEKANG